MVASPQPTDLNSRISQLEALVDNLVRRTAYSFHIGQGGITIDSGGSITLQSGGVINLPVGGTIRDALGNIIFSADSASGQRLSTPFLAIPAAPRWDGNDGATFRAAGSTGDMTFQAQHCMSETTLWSGTIPQVLHPCVSYSAVVGRVTGSTSTPTYRLYVNGDLVDTHATTAYGAYGAPLRSITAITSFGSQGVPFTLTVQSDISSTDYFACTFNALAMCGN